MEAKRKEFRLGFSLWRKLVQIAAFGFCNSHVQNFMSGKIYAGAWKKFCVPGLNCYSCPAATFSCPIGAMQAVSGSMKFNFGFYATGIVLAFGVLFGRAVCAFLCPFGLIQELVHKIPSPKIRLPKVFRYAKYAVLAIFVLILPAADTNIVGMGDPAFCKYICPAGTLEGAIPLLLVHPKLREVIGALFSLKAALLLAVLVLCVFVERFFCKAICPLGAIYALLNKVSFLNISVNHSVCVGCGSCRKVCPMDVNPVESCRHTECILCGKCAEVCAEKAITLKI